MCFFFFKPRTAYGLRISDWSSDVCSSDLFVDRLEVADEFVVLDDLAHHRLGHRHCRRWQGRLLLGLAAVVSAAGHKDPGTTPPQHPRARYWKALPPSYNPPDFAFDLPPLYRPPGLNAP